MGKKILTEPEALKSAGSQISDIEIQSFYEKFPTQLSSSQGLTAAGVNEIIQELQVVETLLDKIIRGFPKKLEAIAACMENADNAAAKNFK